MPTVFETGFGASERELTLDDLPVRGRLPGWLHGTLIRNGPGTFHVGAQTYRHWFDGLAMLHRFAFADGRVSYANKFLRTRSYEAARANGRISYSEFATDPCRSLFGRVLSVFSPQITDSAKVNVARIARRFLALAETPIQVEFDPETLATVGVFQYEAGPVGQMTTVHPQFDFEQDVVYNLVTRYHALSQYRLYRLAGGGQPALAAALPAAQPAYLHSFGLSRRYAIVAEFPLVVNPIDLLLWLRPYIENFRWRPERGAPFYVLDRANGELVGRFDADPYFAFHHVNAFERGDELIVDLDAYPDAGIVQSYYLNRLSDERAELPWGQLRRYRLPLKGRRRGRATYETLSDACLELPRFDYERYNLRGDYRYVYAVSVRPEQRQGFYNQLVKVDVQTGRTLAWHASDCYPGEGVFVGAPGRIREDDGVVLSVVLDAARGTSFLLVLDAETFTERARAELPHAVLFGYHGEYFAPAAEAAR